MPSEAARIYRVVAAGPYLAVFQDGVGLISDGVDIRSEKEALDFLGAVGHEGGLVMNPVRDEHGHLSHVEGTIDPAAVRFSVGSMRELDRLKSAFSAAVRRHAADLAAADGRYMVDDEDMRRALASALEDLAPEPPAGG